MEKRDRLRCETASLTTTLEFPNPRLPQWTALEKALWAVASEVVNRADNQGLRSYLSVWESYMGRAEGACRSTSTGFRGAGYNDPMAIPVVRSSQMSVAEYLRHERESLEKLLNCILLCNQSPAMGIYQYGRSTIMDRKHGVYLLAGTMVLISVALGRYISPWWFLLTAFVGLNLMQSAFTGFCPAEMMLARLGFPEGHRGQDAAGRKP